MLEVINISSGYGKKQVLFDVTLDVKEGEVVLITGGNGSGKSTLLKCVFNLLPLWKGSISYENIRLDKLHPADLTKLGIVYIPQNDFSFDNLTVLENFQVVGSIYQKKFSKEKLQQILNYFPTLIPILNKMSYCISGGEKKLLSIGLGLIHEPRLILFDEPFSGLDKFNMQTINETLSGLNKNGISFLIAEHANNSLLSNKIIQL
jgi:ABC-type branched-subunit amino acid transport system ATPase component